MNEITIRKATKNDFVFIIEAILEAEKSGTDRVSFESLFDITEEQTRRYLQLMLEEEIEGCELSIESFLVAVMDELPVAAAAGWVEGENEENLASEIIKANLISYIIPADNLRNLKDKSDIINGIHIKRKEGTLQIEYVYVKKEFRGYNLSKKLIDEHVKLNREKNQNISFLQIQMFANNASAVNAYLKYGCEIIESKISNDIRILEYMPDRTKILMQKII